MGELAHASVPDLKEAEGGLRDATVLKALVATWLVDVPHVELERSRLALLDVRDLVHDIAGRATDRIAPEMWRELGRAARARRTPRAAQVARARARPPDHPPVPAHLAPRRRRAGPAGLGERAAAAVAAPRWPRASPWPPARSCWTGGPGRPRTRCCCCGPPRRPPSATSCSRRRPRPGWPASARRCPTRGPPRPASCWCGCSPPGRGLLGTWETLEETGALAGFLPEWERIRLLPHASAIHRFTVDRHVVETCIEASALIRRVARPDVLMVAALLHDIGKGSLTEHSVAGEPIARAIATRMGFDADGVELIALLVRWHLLLAETATTRDPDDPATVERSPAAAARPRRWSCSPCSPRPTPGPPRPRRGRRGGPG